MEFVASCLFIVVSVIFRIYWWRWKRIGYLLPPGPPGWPLIGNALDIDPRNPHHTLTDWAKQYGDVYTLNLVGKRTVVVSSSEGIQVNITITFMSRTAISD